MHVALMDGDILIYRCGFAAQKTLYAVYDEEGYGVGEFLRKKEALGRLPPGGNLVESVQAEPLSHALHNVRTMMDRVNKATGAERTIVYLSHGPSFRHHIAKTLPYKANRKDKPPPIYAPEIVRYIQDYYVWMDAPGYEADDLVSIEAYNCKKIKRKCVVVSNDKDLDQIPGVHYNPVKDVTYNITPEQGQHNLYTQVLTGDSTDNIPGLPGIGVKKAAKILRPNEPNKREVALAAYIDYYGITKGHERFLETYRLVKLLETGHEEYIHKSN